MPTGAVLLTEVPRDVDEAELQVLRRDLMAGLCLGHEDFHTDGPLRVVRSRADGPMPTSGDERSTWINVNLWKAYHSPDYPRGDIGMIVRCADWLEARLPGCRIWYGHDVNDENLAPLPAELRRALLRQAEFRSERS